MLTNAFLFLFTICTAKKTFENSKIYLSRYSRRQLQFHPSKRFCSFGNARTTLLVFSCYAISVSRLYSAADWNFSKIWSTADFYSYVCIFLELRGLQSFSLLLHVCVCSQSLCRLKQSFFKQISLMTLQFVCTLQSWFSMPFLHWDQPSNNDFLFFRMRVVTAVPAWSKQFCVAALKFCLHLRRYSVPVAVVNIFTALKNALLLEL